MGFVDNIKEQIGLISKKAGIHGILIIAVIVVALFYVFTGYLQQQITLCVGVLLPAHFSMKALATEGKEDDKQWLTYWTIFGLFVIAELFFGIILKALPFYYIAKLVFLVWLFLPNFQGATFIYDKIIRNLFRSVEKDIDRLANKVTGKKTS